jgi:predicted histone-like DNA-binding protein
MPGKPTSDWKWYAIIRIIGQLTEKAAARLIADETTLNAKEAEMALSLYQKILINALLNGQSVQLGDWGSFHLTCHSAAHDTREEVTGRSIEKLNIRFTPGKALKEAIAKATFTSTDSLTETKG